MALHDLVRLVHEADASSQLDHAVDRILDLGVLDRYQHQPSRPSGGGIIVGIASEPGIIGRNCFANRAAMGSADDPHTQMDHGHAVPVVETEALDTFGDWT